MEWAESQSHHWAWGCVQDLNTTSAVFCWCGWENVRHPSIMCQLPNCWADGIHPNLVVADASSLNVEQMAASYIQVFSFTYLYQSKGIVLNIKRKALISILQQKLLLEVLQVIIRLQISILRKGNHHVLFCWRVLYRQKSK